MEEVHRFSNDPVMLCGTFYWDILRLFFEIKQGIVKANAAGGFESIGVETCGADLGLIGKDGVLLENPVNYRDRRTSGILPKAYEKISPEELYSVTGIEIMEINTAFQLLSLKLCREELLNRTEKILLTPDLFNFFLTGELHSELSIASTTGLLDAKTKDWSDKVITSLGLPRSIFPEIIPSGTQAGMLTEELFRGAVRSEMSRNGSLRTRYPVRRRRSPRRGGGFHIHLLRHLVTVRHRNGQPRPHSPFRKIQHHQRNRLWRKDHLPQEHHRTVVHTGNKALSPKTGSGVFLCRP